MNKQEILESIRGCEYCFLGTVSNGKPHVRGMMPYTIEPDGIIFHTGKMKDLYKQLLKNPEVELCFYSSKKMLQIRVSGAAEILDDIELKKEIVSRREFLKPMIQQIGYDAFIVFRVKGCIATVWTMDKNLSQKEYIFL